ncbi:MAG: hypothetical protein U9P90_00840 [Patescibacteria group bacterium]|nr:hypothetical protein [Patescibacteria group bacterium]
MSDYTKKCAGCGKKLADKNGLVLEKIFADKRLNMSGETTLCWCEKCRYHTLRELGEWDRITVSTIFYTEGELKEGK